MEVALKHTKLGKAPEPDGLPTKYYKQFFKILALHFIEVLNSITKNKTIPDQALSAIITFLPKKGKDPSTCTSYRPILLINTDFKLFSKVLYLRVIPHIPVIVHLDEVGLFPKTEDRDITIRALNIFHKASSLKLPCLLLSMNANKAFDRIDWLFIQCTLEHLGIKTHMLS